ncbi:MAG: transposase [Verrucomicrobiota bacterium]|nr:transposase [Verrucomicrobiota bacterium]
MTVDNRKQRLLRLDRVFERNPIYFVTACSAERRPILADQMVHSAFVAFAERSESAWLGAYVFMPDHLHLFVAIDDQQTTLSRWMKSLKNSISKVLRARGVASPHWQKGFFDHASRSEESYEEKWCYVRENPVRAGLVSEWERWPFAGEIYDLRFEGDRRS